MNDNIKQIYSNDKLNLKFVYNCLECHHYFIGKNREILGINNEDHSFTHHLYTFSRKQCRTITSFY